MEVANTLSYYNTEANTAVKSFIVQAPGPGRKFVFRTLVFPKGPVFPNTFSVVINRAVLQAGPNAIKLICRVTLQIILHFVTLQIQPENNFTLQFTLS
jgi:hypothetical protein